MKKIGSYQLRKMKFPRLILSERFKALLGELPVYFLAGVIGESAQGKSEWMQQFAEELTIEHDDVNVYVYETGYSADLQEAMNRNDGRLKNHMVHWCNPWEDIQPCKIDFPKSGDDDIDALFGDFVNQLTARNSPTYHIVDSVDRAGFTKAQILWLDKTFCKSNSKKKKGIIFLIHAENSGTKPILEVGKKILFYSSWSVRVHNFIAYPRKSRFSATECYVVWEKRAKELNPEFFGIVPTLKAKPKKKKSKVTAKRKQDDKGTDND
jgi:hypothetical protein